MVTRNPLTTEEEIQLQSMQPTCSSNITEEERERIWKENYFHKDKQIRRMWRVTSNGRYGIK